VSAETTRRVVGLGLGILLVLAFAAFATFGNGFTDPDVPDGSVAVVEDVEDGEVTQEEFDSTLEQVAASQGLKGAPKPKDPQYQQFVDAAISDLILERWILGETADRGVTVSDREVEQRLEQIRQQNFGSQKEFEDFLEESGFTEEEALERVRLTLLSEALQESVVEGTDVVPQEDIETLYEQQKSQFTTPETRSVLTVANKDKAKVEQAAEALAEDDSPQNWAKVAEQYSTDPSASDGGELPEVREGEADPAFDEAVFGAAEGELVGPFETSNGWQIIQVTGITPEEVAPLDKVSKTIEDQLAAAQQQQALDSFESGLEAKWRDRTFCSEELIPDKPAAAEQSTLSTRCTNIEAPAPDACTIDDEEERAQAAPEQLTAGCPAFVTSRNPATPQELSEDDQQARAQAQLQPLQQPYTMVPGSFPQGQPQRPFYAAPADQPLPGALPPGSIPIGAPGAGGVPPTGAPPTAAPPTGAPPTGAAPPPTGGAPPAGAPPAP
jgi:parvulin-like peptidyl-prolyl isomerase